MTIRELRHSFGDQQIDQTLIDMIAKFAAAFPNRLRAVYVTGSYLDGSYLPTSDIDGFVVFKDDMSFAEFGQAWSLGQECSGNSAIPLDFAPIPERVLRRYGTVDLKLASRIIYGEDIRDEIELLDVGLQTYFMMEEGLRRLGEARSDQACLTYPVDFPDRDGEFYGYNQRQVADSAGNVQQGTKTLMNIVGKPATAIILQQTGRHVKNKRDAIQRYQTDIADDWAPLVRDVYEKCRNQWHYLVPESAADRETLRALCRRALEFENHFLTVLRDFLLTALEAESTVSAWLPAGDLQMLMGLSLDDLTPLIAAGKLPAREVDGQQEVYIAAFDKHVAARMLTQVVYPGDQAVLAALRAAAAADPLLAQAAARALAVQGESWPVS